MRLDINHCWQPVTIVMFDIIDSTISSSKPAEGTEVFRSYDDLFAALSQRVAKAGFKVVKARSHRSRVNGTELPTNDIIRIDLVCDRGGRAYQCHATKHKTTTKKTGCPWKAKAVNRRSAGGWDLTIRNNSHNHAPGTPEPSAKLSATDVNGVVSLTSTDAEVAFARASCPTEMLDDTLNGLAAAPTEELFSLPTFGVDSNSGQVPTTAIRTNPLHNNIVPLTGDGFDKLKQEYHKFAKVDRFRVLAQFQLHMAAIDAVENDLELQERQQVSNHRHIVAEQLHQPDIEMQATSQGAAAIAASIMASDKHKSMTNCDRLNVSAPETVLQSMSSVAVDLLHEPLAHERLSESAALFAQLHQNMPLDTAHSLLPQELILSNQNYPHHHLASKLPKSRYNESINIQYDGSRDTVSQY